MTTAKSDSEEFLEGVIEGVQSAIPPQLVLDEARAWDGYLLALLKRHSLKAAIQKADELLESRRLRFNMKIIKASMVDGNSPAEIRVIK
jgi:hypothetical protein